MKYAFISDIHGNLPALQAVIDDARAQTVDCIIMLGDYIMDLPWPNEVTETLRALENAIIVGGNKESYISRMVDGDQSEWTHEQFAPMYWNLRALTPDNLRYLISLPVSLEIMADNGDTLHLAHSSSIFLRAPKPRIQPFHSSFYLQRMREKPFTHDEYLAFSREAVLEHDEALSEIKQLPKGIYTFGHNHLQWYMELNGRIFINPGSCGMPLDFDTRTPYTVLEHTDNGWRIEERRVFYDNRAAVNALRSSELYTHAEIWSRIMVTQLETGGDYISHFLRHAFSIAQERGERVNPVGNDVWREAAETFTYI